MANASGRASGSDRDGCRESKKATHEQVALFYDAVAEEFEAEYYGPDGDPAIQIDVGAFAEMLDAARLMCGGRVLEVGCGTGHWMRWLQDRDEGVIPVGVDVSYEMAREAVRRQSGLVVVADASHLPFRSSAFEGVLSPYCALDHVPAYAQSFSEISRVARGGAWLCLMLDNRRRFIRSYWKLRSSNVRSLGSDTRTGEWQHEVGDQVVSVFTYMFDPDEVADLLPEWKVTFGGLAMLTPLVPRRMRAALRWSTLRTVLSLSEGVARRIAARRAAFLVVTGRKQHR